MIYRATIGSSVALVDAKDEAEAREYIGTKLGYAHKPYLWDRIELTQPTEDQLERDRALGLKVATAKIARDPSEGRAP
jgi:hypothetical protein